MDIMQYVDPLVLVLIPALIVVGAVLKRVPKIPDWTIPVVLLVIGVVAAMAICGWSIVGAVQGVLVTGTAVYGNQLVKQIGEGVSGGGDE